MLITVLSSIFTIAYVNQASVKNEAGFILLKRHFGKIY